MPKVFKAITRLIYYSNGGFSFSELYSEVPVYVRRFLIDEIETIKKEEKKAMEGDGGGGAPTASAEDTQKAMEQLRKQSDESTGDAEKDLEKVFGTEEEREKRTGSPGEPRQRKEPPKNPQQKTEDKEESSDKKPPEEDPAAADDLEQMIDKLKQDM